MPNVNHARWLVTYTAPFDGHQYRHNRVVNTLDDEKYVRNQWKNQNNPDWKILRVQKLSFKVSEAKAVVDAADKENRDHGGDGYRIPVGSEDLLTQEQVDEILAGREEAEPDALPPIPGTTFGG